MNISDRMSAATDKAKGHAKEAYGKVTNDDSKVAEGKFDKAKGEVKEIIEDVKGQIKESRQDNSRD